MHLLFLSVICLLKDIFCILFSKQLEKRRFFITILDKFLFYDKIETEKRMQGTVLL